MMDDLIWRRDVVNYIEGYGIIDGYEDTQNCIRGIKALPPAQSEINTGRWIYEETQYKISSYRCSECGRHVLYESESDVCEAYPYCHCGAKMLKNDEVYANEWLGL